MSHSVMLCPWRLPTHYLGDRGNLIDSPSTIDEPTVLLPLYCTNSRMCSPRRPRADCRPSAALSTKSTWGQVPHFQTSLLTGPTRMRRNNFRDKSRN
ncbi:hypothetical protein LINPERPRIM_LOCUS21904, partial [Linum perenne]